MPFRKTDLPALWRMSRPGNLGIAALSYALAAWLAQSGEWHWASSRVFWLEAVLMLLIMAGGYWINDVFDRRIDLVNKPQRTIVNVRISAKKVFSIYFVGMLVCIGASFALLPDTLAAINTAAVWLLYLYAQVFKREALVGNLIVALLTALTLLTGGLQGHPWRLSLVWAMCFAFVTTLIREIAKDVEDLRGDLQHNLRTLPILVGIRQAKRLLVAGYIILAVGVQLPWVVSLLLWGKFPWLYVVLTVVLVNVPLVFFTRELLHAVRPSDFGRQSRRLKWLMLVGMVCLAALVK